MRGDYHKALIYAVIAGWTDYFDGFLARHMNWGSRIGAYLDPLADKVMISAIYAALAIAGAVPWWLVAIIFGRDVFILIGAGALYARIKQQDFPPSMAGKISTTIQILAGVTVMAAKADIVPTSMIAAAVYSAAAGTLISGLDYVRQGARMLKK